jgi:hypothetical protein
MEIVTTSFSSTLKSALPSVVAVMVGISFTAATLTVAVEILLSELVSLALNVKVSEVVSPPLCV